MAEQRRLDLQAELEAVMGSLGKVYFEPDRNVKLAYPCICYFMSHTDYSYTNNLIYLGHRQYDVSIIDRDPDSDLPKRLEEHGFYRLRFDRAYLADNLHHFVYKLYY